MKTQISFSFLFRTHVSESVHALPQVNSHIQKENSFGLFALIQNCL
jgi:hypothetical protein